MEVYIEMYIKNRCVLLSFSSFLHRLTLLSISWEEMNFCLFRCKSISWEEMNLCFFAL